MDMCVCEDIYAAEICISADNTFRFQSDGEMHVPPQIFESRWSNWVLCFGYIKSGFQPRSTCMLNDYNIATQTGLHSYIKELLKGFLFWSYLE